MKANEFVKKFGWGKAKEVSSFTSNVCEDPTHFDSDLDIYVHFDDFKGVMDESDVCINDLKRLVESWELVEECGGLAGAKERVSREEGLPNPNVFYVLVVSSAIDDVESCLEADKKLEGL